MKEQFCIYEMLRKKTDINEELHGNVMILGVAGGNGLEHILWRCLKELGYDEVDAFNTPLPNGKYLLRIDFAKSMERYISG